MIKVAGLRLTSVGVADGFREEILRSLNVAASGEGEGGEAASTGAGSADDSASPADKDACEGADTASPEGGEAGSKAAGEAADAADDPAERAAGDEPAQQGSFTRSASSWPAGMFMLATSGAI